MPSSPRLSVVLVAHDLAGSGGMERAMRELITRTAGDVSWTVVSATVPDDLVPCVTWHRVRVPPRPVPLKFLVFYVVAGLRLRRLRAGIVHSCGAIVPNRVDVASVHFCHAGFRAATGRWAPAGAPWTRRLNTGVTRLLGVAAERWSYRPGCVRVLAPVSRGLADEVGRHYPGVPVVVTPNGADPPREGGLSRDVLRARLGSPPGVPVVLFVGGNWDHKGLGPLIAAFGLMGCADAELWVVGPGDSRRFGAMAQRAGVAGRVRFVGPVDDASPYYRAADVFALPSSYEAFPLVVIEAAAAGMPIVAAPVSGVTDLVEDGVSGRLVPAEPAALSAVLDALVADPALRRSLGDEARRRSSAFTWERATATVQSLYRDLRGS